MLVIVPCPPPAGACRSAWARAIRRGDLAKRQIHSGCHGPLGSGDCVLPVFLRLALHHQQTPVGQIQVKTLVRPVDPPKAHSSGRTQAKRRNHRLPSELPLVVRVPPHRVLSIAIEVGQNRVKRMATGAGEPAPKRRQRGAPGLRRVIDAGVAVVGARVAVPGDEAWYRHLPPVHLERLATPGDLRCQLSQPSIGLLGIDSLGRPAEAGAGEFDTFKARCGQRNHDSEILRAAAGRQIKPFCPPDRPTPQQQQP